METRSRKIRAGKVGESEEELELDEREGQNVIDDENAGAEINVGLDVEPVHVVEEEISRDEEAADPPIASFDHNTLILQMLAEMNAKLANMNAEMDSKLGNLKAEINSNLNVKLETMNAEMNSNLDNLKAEMNTQFSTNYENLTREFQNLRGEIREEIVQLRADTALEISQINVRMDNFDAKTGEIQREQRDCFNKIQEDFVDIKQNVAKLDHVAGQQCEKMTIVEARIEQCHIFLSNKMSELEM